MMTHHATSTSKVGACLLLLLPSTTLGFTSPSASSARTTTATTLHLSSSSGSNSFSEAVLSTLLAPVNQPARGVTNPWFGPPDTLLEAGKSIPPSHVNQVEWATPVKSMVTSPTTDAELHQVIPGSDEYSHALRDYASDQLSHGYKILNAEALTMKLPTLDAPYHNNQMPGFSDIHGILPTRLPWYDFQNPDIALAQAQFSGSTASIFSHMAFAAFLYALVEFLFLRPSIDVYQDELEADEVGAMADFLTVSLVRFMGLFAVGVVTKMMYG